MPHLLTGIHPLFFLFAQERKFFATGNNRHLPASEEICLPVGMRVLGYVWQCVAV